MKPVVVVFLLAEAFDVTTTVVANTYLGTWEIFPAAWLVSRAGWTGVLAFKAVVIFGVGFILQKATIKSKLVWLVAAVPVLTVVWNLINICAEIWAKLI